jgi:glutamine synthetase
MSKAKDVLKKIKDEEIEWVDLRFTDPKGKWQHLTMVAGVMGEDELEDGLMFDGSSIAGWKAINESDMILKPDLSEVWLDPFSATPMLIINCDIVEPSTGDWYSRDPRTTAKRAEAFLKSTGIGDTVYVGPEAEFFMFDDVRFEDGYAGSGFSIDDIELPTNTAKEYDNGNMGHRPRAKGGYFPVAPVDSAVDIRGEMVSTWTSPLRPARCPLVHQSSSREPSPLLKRTSSGITNRSSRAITMPLSSCGETPRKTQACCTWREWRARATRTLSASGSCAKMEFPPAACLRC